MGELKFQVLKKLVFDYYAKLNYEKSLDVAILAAEHFPEKKVQTSYWLICLYSRLGQRKRAIELLRNCINNEIWWSPKRLIEDEDLFPIQQELDFHEIIEKSRVMEEKAKEKARPELFVHLPKGYGSHREYPLLLSLHWQNGNIADYQVQWVKHPLAKEYIMAFPQSSQISAVNEYNWDNEILGEQEVGEALKKLVGQYSVNQKEIIIAGASQGARLAIKIALGDNTYPLKGFIAVIPTVERIDALISSQSLAKRKGLRGCIIAGEQDPYFPWAASLQRALRHTGVPCKLIKVNTLGHYFPSDFTKYLKSAVEFVS